MEYVVNTYMPFSSDAEIETIGAGLLERTLPKREWTHRAHFSVAVWVLTRRPDLRAEDALPRAIRAYNEATGVANTDTAGYHETITRASIAAARAFVALDASPELYATCNALMESRLGAPAWICTYWSRERLFTPEARRAWVPPDLEEFPFRSR